MEIFSLSSEDIEIFYQLSEGKIPSRYYIIRKYILRCFLSKADPQIPFLNSVRGDTNASAVTLLFVFCMTLTISKYHEALVYTNLLLSELIGYVSRKY